MKSSILNCVIAASFYASTLLLPLVQISPALGYANVNPSKGWLSARRLSQRDLNPVGNITPLGTPVALQSAAVSATSASSLALTTNANSPAGATIVVASHIGSNNTTISSLTDSAGNSYSLAKAQTPDRSSSIWYSTTSVALPSGGTITATYSGSPGASGGSILAAASIVGLTASPLDKTAGAIFNAATSQPSGATATLSQAKEVAFGVAGGGTTGGGNGFSAASGWTRIANLENIGTNHEGMEFDFIVVNATTALNFSPTSTTASYGESVIATFKGN